MVTFLFYLVRMFKIITPTGLEPVIIASKAIVLPITPRGNDK